MRFRLLQWRKDKKAMFAFVAFYILFGTIISIFQERIIYHPYEQDFKIISNEAGAGEPTHRFLTLERR